MKKYLFTLAILFVAAIAFAQPGKKPAVKQKAPAQSEMDKAMEDAMKGMSEDEKAEMRKMMKGVMPELAKKPGSDVAPFTDNKKLIPAKDINRINSIPKKIFTDADVSANTALLYTKLMAKIPASEKAIITSIMGKAKKGSELMEAAITSFMQGHNPAAIGLAIKAVQAEPKNANHQNNLAAILSQSGYPERAIPYLKKLSNQFPSNSTVLHNLGYAWLSLGQIDTARRLFAYAAVRNPNNPETKLCRGVIEELKGDPKKATDNYVESFEDAPNPFTENLAKNVKAEGRLEKIDFEKLKSRIIIYEYFKKDWIKIPALSDNVSAYEANMNIKNGFKKMFEDLDKKIEEMVEASNAEVDALIDKGVTEFAETMMKESMKGLSMMSMPAVYVQKILQAHIAKWTEDYVREGSALMEKINAQKIVMTKIGNNDKCPDHDRKNNEFLAYANPLIRKFQAKKIEEARVWLNAFCTWSWYIAGNPKNSIMTQCIAWTGFIAEMYEAAIENQFAIAKSCVNQNSFGVTYTPAPAIPNFTCPAVVSIPFGLDELRLNADAVNFDNNDWNIKQAEGAAIPNVTLSFGADKNDITEPGKYGNPYVKTGNGSINTSGIGSEEELTPLSKIMDDLTPLSKIPLDELAPLNPALLDADKKLSSKDYNKIRNAELTRKLLNEMMKTKCPGELPVKKTRKPKFEVGLGELVLEPIFEVGLGELELWDEEMQAWVNSKGEYRVEGILELPPMAIGDIETNGLQTAINNGLEAIGKVKNFIKGLFD
jgi:Flp pilus assembly protein TadD